MSGCGILANDPASARLMQADFDAAVQGALGAALQRQRDEVGAMIEAMAARVRTGAPRRAAYETPVNRHDYSPEEKAVLVPLLMGLAGSIRAGLGEIDLPESQG